MDIEQILIRDTLAHIAQTGLVVSPISVANLIVAVKSKPMILLIGPQNAAKETLLSGFGKALTTEDSYQYQEMVGHPWWANRTNDMARYTNAQSRFNTLKLELMIEEARLPENYEKVFIAGLTHISATELQEYFTDTAFQLQHGQLMRLPTLHFSEPIPFPANLFIVGTMETNASSGLDHDLLSQTTIIQCAPIHLTSTQVHEIPTSDPFREKYLIRSFIRNPQRAFQKLFKILRGLSAALFPFVQIKKILQNALSVQYDNAIPEGMIYLANSWSSTGQGLFDVDKRKNLQIAMDLAITQSLLLPCGEEIFHLKNLGVKLQRVLGSQFPHSLAYLQQIDLA